MEGSQLSDNTRSNVNNRDTGMHFSNESILQKSMLMVSSIDQNGVVNRQESSSSLCSWSSFDTSLTDDNSSGTDDNAVEDESRTEGLTLNQLRKVFICHYIVVHLQNYILLLKVLASVSP